MSKISSAAKNEEYCVLFREDKGYFLSKTKVAVSMELEYILTGSKKECLEYIDKNNEILKSAE